MKVIFVQTYPVYHDLWSLEEWLSLEGRHRWMPGVLSEMGCDVELWGGAGEDLTVESELGDFGSYTIRLFATNSSRRQTKFHYSDRMVKHARRTGADMYVLKGVDGGIGTRLLRKYLLPEDVPFSFIIGGKYYTRIVPRANLVFYETEQQKQHLMNPGFRLWRQPVEEWRLVRLPKSVNTDLFRPIPETPKKWDIISVGRLMRRYKSYDALGQLARHIRVAVAGDGEAEAELKSEYPQVDWLGRVDHHVLPKYLNQAHLFMHGGRNDYFPRVIAEAAACGMPCVAFADAIKPDVMPPQWGLRIREKELPGIVRRLLADPARMDLMSKNARAYALENWHKKSTRDALQHLINPPN